MSTLQNAILVLVPVLFAILVSASATSGQIATISLVGLMAGAIANRSRPTKKTDPASILNRNPMLPICEVDGMLDGQCILVTGAGGTVGSALCEHALRAGARKVIALDHSEFALYSLGEALASDERVEMVLGSVCDPVLLAQLFASNVHTVYHAAAYKHVGLVEKNPLGGLANNVLGTKTVAEAAQEAGVDQFVLVSTDKAAQPRGVMGASKRMAELVVQNIASQSENTKFAIVRFGNVFGSSGSVVPRFKSQIAAGGPVTLSDRNATRFFVTLERAAEFVVYSGAHAKRGQILTLDMGRAIRIEDLASRMIAAAGSHVGSKRDPGAIEIEITGLESNENLCEAPCRDGAVVPTCHPRVYQVLAPQFSQIETAKMVRCIVRAIDEQDGRAAISLTATVFQNSQTSSEGILAHATGHEYRPKLVTEVA